MPKQQRSLTADEVGLLIALLALMLGGFIYLYQPWTAGFPINDGGLFYKMVRTVQANGFKPPDYVEYNGLRIPFVYPPLGLYLGALLSSLFRVDAIVIIQWLPGVILIVVAACFYLLARQLLPTGAAPGIATFLYVCTPRSSTWLVMGGGLTRSLGQLLLVLTLGAVYAMYTRRTRGRIAVATVFGSLVVLSHPEAALHTAALCLLFFLVVGRNRRAATDSMVTAAGVILLTSVWWLLALQRYGIAPFISAGGTVSKTPFALAVPLLVLFTEEPAMTLIAVMAVIGFFAAIARREYLLPAALLVPFLADPRSNSTVAIVPAALLASLAITQVILPGLVSASAKPGNRALLPSDLGWAPKVALLYMGAFVLFMALYAGAQLAQMRLSPEDRTAMGWISERTPTGSRFLVLTGETQLFCDPIQEWFPALTDRVSQTTIQGTEWSSGEFERRSVSAQDLQLCEVASNPLECVQAKAQAASIAFDYIYVTGSNPVVRFCRPTGMERSGQRLIEELSSSTQFESAYRTEDVAIFSRH